MNDPRHCKLPVHVMKHNTYKMGETVDMKYIGSYIRALYKIAINTIGGQEYLIQVWSNQFRSAYIHHFTKISKCEVHIATYALQTSYDVYGIGDKKKFNA